jgi:hypothetical protein
MPRVCTVCRHDERAAIERALVANEPYRSVMVRYGLSKAALIRHKADHLPAALLAAQAAADEARALDVMRELRNCFMRVNLLFDACDRWLRDAGNPEQYDIGPRAGDVTVTYETIGADGRRTRKKERLSVLLARVEKQPGISIDSTEVKHADPRELVLKTAARLEGHVRLLAELIGQLDNRPQLNVTLSPEWLRVRATLTHALAPYPDARHAVAEAIAALEAGEPSA